MASAGGESISYLSYNTPLLTGQSYTTIYAVTSQYESLSFMFKADQETTVNAYWKNDPADPDVVLAFTSTYNPVVDPGGIILNTNVKGVYFSYTLENTSGVDQTILSSSCYGSNSLVTPPDTPVPSTCFNRNDGDLTYVSMDGYNQPYKSLGGYFTEVSYTAGGLVPTALGVWQNTTSNTLTVRSTLSTGYTSEGLRFVIQVDGVDVEPWWVLPTASNQTHTRQLLFEVPSNSVVRIMGSRSTSAATPGNIRFLSDPRASFELTSFPSSLINYP